MSEEYGVDQIKASTPRSNGKVENVKISGGGETNVTVDGASVTAKEYDISGSTNYKIWFDKAGIPVMFVVDDDSGEVTFTLKK